MSFLPMTGGNTVIGAGGNAGAAAAGELVRGHGIKAAAKTGAHVYNDAAVVDPQMHASEAIRKYTGWRGHDAIIARAVMGSESGYKSDAANACCVGLMQVNCDAHNGHFGTPKGEDACRKKMTEVVPNLQSAYKIFQAQGWGAWESYTNGMYKNFLGKDPIISVSGKGTVTGAASDIAGVITSPLKAIAAFINALMSGDTWFRIGKGALGFVLIALGVGAMVFIVANRVKTTNIAKAVKG